MGSRNTTSGSERVASDFWEENCGFGMFCFSRCRCLSFLLKDWIIVFIKVFGLIIIL